ncbi:MAG: CBS domain-containing protein [Proteobacteria bacterium]|nr:CBS domain-containing protein [Pseudomonadota bacterium]
MQARDVMTKPVISVAPEATLREVMDILLKHRISGVPVVEQDTVLGFVGVGDLLHRYEIGTDRMPDERPWWQRLVRADPGPMDYVRSHGIHARDLMNREVVSVAEDTHLSQITKIFEQRRIRRVPVLRDDGHMVGLVTRADLVRVLAAKCASVSPAGEGLDDEQIRARLLEELAGHSWWSQTWSDLSVNQGIVHFIGLVQRDCQRDAARIAAENIPGVRGVRDDRRLVHEVQAVV